MIRAVSSLVAAAVLTGCCCCPCGFPLSPEERARLEKERAERRAKEEAEEKLALEKAPGRLESWKTAHTFIAAHSFESSVVKCDDTLLKAELDNPIFRNDLASTDFNALPGAGAGEAWKFLNSGDVDDFQRWMDHPDDSSVRYWKPDVGARKNRFQVVFKSDDRAEASGFDEGGMFSEGGFNGATFEGFIAVVDLDERKVICSAPIEVENSDEVTYDDEGLFKTTFEEAVQDDFEENFEEAANQALERMSKHISVNIHGIF